MNATNGQEVWYLARDGKQHGPLSDVEMIKLVELGHLRDTDLVWRPGFSDWRPALSVFPPPAAAAPQPVAPPAAPPPSNAPPEPASEPAPATYASQIGAAEPQPAGAPSAQPVTSEPSPFIPVGTTSHPSTGSHFGSAPYSQPFETGDTFHNVRPAEPLHREQDVRKSNRGVLVFVALLALIGGISAAGYLFRDSITGTIAGLTASTPDADKVAEAPASATETAASTDAPPPAEPSAAAQPTEPTPVATAAVDASPEPPTLSPVTADPAAIDADLQKSPMWSLLKTEFPDWYAERVRDVGQMKSEQKPDDEINTKLTESIVALRRQNAEKALAASPQRLQEIATAFVANLTAMQTQSVDACYGFISKGETTPAAAALVQNPVEGSALHAQLQAVFAAVAEGGKSPAQRSQPQKSDYDLLAAELGTIGWSQADIQLFADPKALSEAPRDRVCKMVRDWFSAHIAVKDDAARERLLFETLRPVVAG